MVPEHSKGKKRASCSLSSTLEVGAPMLCRHLVGPNLPIKLDGKKYSVDEKFFIATEVDRMLKQGLIRKSHSSWRSQVEVVKSPQNWQFKVNYSQTINKRFSNGIVEMTRIQQSLEKLKPLNSWLDSTFRDGITLFDYTHRI